MDGKLTISRPQFGDGRKVIQIRVKDELSRAQFLTVSVNLEDFAEALTGMAEVPVSLEVKNLREVGKLRQQESRSVRYDGPRYCREIMTEWLRTEMQEPGWIVNPYIGSQGSVTYNSDGSCTIKYSVYRYVEAAENDSKEPRP